MHTIRLTNIAIFHEMTISRACIALGKSVLGIMRIIFVMFSFYNS